MTALKDLLARSTPASHRNEPGADRTRELLAKMFPAERPLTDLQRARAALDLALEYRAHLPRNSSFLAAARERVARCRAEVKRLSSSVSNPKE